MDTRYNIIICCNNTRLSPPVCVLNSRVSGQELLVLLSRGVKAKVLLNKEADRKMKRFAFTLLSILH